MSTPHVLSHRPKLCTLLQSLHKESLEQEERYRARGSHFPGLSGAAAKLEDQLVALDQDKASAMYLMLRAANARRVVEAGTSHGVSLLWLLAAVLDNEATGPSPNPPSLVVGTENEPQKASVALQNVEKGFGLRPAALDLLEGDILETLPGLDLPNGSVDALLLDIWAPLALPTLQIMESKLRLGGMVFIDNTVSSADRYSELLTYLRSGNAFKCCTLPHSGGFELCVKVA